MWDVADVCRTCDQLGCPGLCKDGKGCTACPRGLVRLATVQPAGLRKKDWQGYCTGLRPKPCEPVPTLPFVCLRPGADLHCADGEFKDGVGCTRCKRGWRLGPIRPAFIAGSSFLQLQVAGSACYRA